MAQARVRTRQAMERGRARSTAAAPRRFRTVARRWDCSDSGSSAWRICGGASRNARVRVLIGSLRGERAERQPFRLLSSPALCWADRLHPGVTVYTFNPLSDTRWDDLVRAHPHASIFHSRGWLEALQRTYGFEPVVFTTSPPGTPLNDGIVLCGVRSWL